MSLSITDLSTAVGRDAAFRMRQRLQPVGGAGDKVFPPTYPGEGREGPQHVFEIRRLEGESVATVLLDSPQSSANRHEEVELELARSGRIELPYMTVDFSSTAVPEIGEITSLDAPHRIYDAILRDSLLDGVPLMQSDVGKALQLATSANAAAIFEHSPSSLLFGAWNSTGEGGGLGAKFPRAFVSEIVGVNVPVRDDRNGNMTTEGRRTGSRIDPLGVLKGVQVFKGPTGWDTKDQKGFKKSKPSEINHGNIAPSVSALGVTMDYAEQTVVIGFAGLRRLRFGGGERDAAARTVLAALGLVTYLALRESGYALRSRCELVPDGRRPLELVRFDGSTNDIDLDLDGAVALYADAVRSARRVGFTYSAMPIRLVPQEKLVEIVRQSRALALAGKGGETEETTSAGA